MSNETAASINSKWIKCSKQQTSAHNCQKPETKYSRFIKMEHYVAIKRKRILLHAITHSSKALCSVKEKCLKRLLIK